MSNERNGILKKIVVWTAIGLMAIVALKVILAIAGFVIGIGFLALFTIGPILLVGWLVVKALRYFTRDPAMPTAG
ncbi:MAG: hypothetical protein WD737_07595 [Gemmatimonadota bacterium]